MSRKTTDSKEYLLAERLLHDYGYVFAETQSNPCSICKTPFSPYRDKEVVEKNFCDKNCCLLPKTYLNTFCEYFCHGKCDTSEYSSYLIYCEKQNGYIQKIRDTKTGKEKNIDYESPKRYVSTPKKRLRCTPFWRNHSENATSVSEPSTTEKREQIVIYFLMFSYIQLGLEKRKFFDSLLQDVDDCCHDPIFSALQEKFNSYDTLSGEDSSISMYGLITEYQKSKNGYN